MWMNLKALHVSVVVNQQKKYCCSIVAAQEVGDKIIHIIILSKRGII